MSRQITHDGLGALQIRFSFDRRLVDLVKTLANRRWNPAEKFWWVPESDVVAVVDLLRREGFGLCEATQRLYVEGGGTLTIDVASPAPRGTLLPGLFDPEADERAPSVTVRDGNDYTVSRLNEQVRAALEAAFPASIWLVGEISGFAKSAHKRIVTFHLVERDENGKTLAEVSATLFDSDRREIESALAAAGNPFRIEDEITVRVRARVDLYVAWGSYRVVVEEIDLSYTLGEAARRREEIVRKLTEEGILERNRSLPLPPVPLRVGLVTSLGSDAYNDVLRTLEESGYAFRVTVHGARVQGRATEPSVLNALDWFRSRIEHFDVLLICRGGGSRTDLAWFDSEPLARAVASYPVPVVVGIGHEQDLSALDFVGRRAKTPTAAATLLVERIAAAQEALESTASAVLERAARILREERRDASARGRRLALAVRRLLERETQELTHRRRRTVRGAGALLLAAREELRHRGGAIPRAAWLLLGRRALLLREAARQLGQGARRDLATARRRTDEAATLLAPRAARFLTREGERSGARARRLHLVDPRRVVERGYAILRRADGRVLTESASAAPGESLRAELRRGVLLLRSEGPEEA